MRFMFQGQKLPYTRVLAFVLVRQAVYLPARLCNRVRLSVSISGAITGKCLRVSCPYVYLYFVNLSLEQAIGGHLLFFIVCTSSLYALSFRLYVRFY